MAAADGTGESAGSHLQIEGHNQWFFRTAPLAKAICKSRCKWPAWSVALLLTFAVSFWGLHYKLSLYHPPAVHAQGPAAKLLSQKERPVSSAQLDQAANIGKPFASTHQSTAVHALAVFVIAAFVGISPERLLLSAAQPAPHHLQLVPAQPSAPRAPPFTI